MHDSEHPIVNERRKVREKPHLHFQRVAKMWEGVIGCSISPEQVILCMALLKIAREAGVADQDNIDDAVGYLSLIPEVRSYLEPCQAAPAPLMKEYRT